ncbi:interleukin-7 receptor subunit alpha isoform X2 [Hypomesus transpacificus]|uniref:interleukin-7 receptor subunit alpha isoform X2 n=1 Tax=Hypomesus transpacificus TaxID=137520 RepID=UPI001F07874C|nr:interleukin-7 receptor subunit alpha isoform X2 [Hypomesus transpacificus]
MAQIWWIALLLVPTTTLAQSGDPDDDDGASLTCSSDISIHLNNLTCLLSEEEEVEVVTLCWFSEPGSQKTICLEESRPGKDVTFSNLEMLTVYNLTYRLMGGSVTKQKIELKKIVKPKTPWVVNTTYVPGSDTHLIQIGTPYKNDYLSQKLQFELEIWSADSLPLTPTISYQDYTIEGEYLKKNTLYHIRVRAKPIGDYFKGFWSEWSPSVSFTTYREDLRWDQPVLMYILSLAFVILLLLTMTAVFFWRKRIKSLIWPSIPHPKHTLVHLYHPSKHPPVSFNPEMFSDLSVRLVQKVPELSTDDSSGTGASEATLLSSAASNECSEMGSEATTMGLLDLGSGPDTTQTDTDAGDGDGVPESVEVRGRGKEEAYVTMSSFYQVKLQEAKSKKVET